MNCSWKIRNSCFLEQSTILYGNQGPGHVFFLSAPPPNHTKSLGSFPWQTGVVGLGGLPGSLQSCRAEGIPWVSGGVRGLEEGGGVERPPSFNPDQGEEMQVH